MLTRANFRVFNSVFLSQVRKIQSNDSLLDGCVQVRNKNPRNLELLTIARKPQGYSLEKDKRNYWHRLVFIKKDRHVTLQLYHFENGVVINVSTKDFALKNQLQSLSDTTAYVNLARVFAQRCIESGIISMQTLQNEKDNVKLNRLLEELEKSGLILQEATRFKDPNPWDRRSQQKPWEICP